MKVQLKLKFHHLLIILQSQQVKAGITCKFNCQKNVVLVAEPANIVVNMTQSRTMLLRSKLLCVVTVTGHYNDVPRVQKDCLLLTALDITVA